MQTKLVVIISTREPAKARTGVMYAVNALKHGWMEEVRLFLFGPAQDLLLVDDELQELVRDYRALAQDVVACRFFAERDGTAAVTAAQGLKIEYVGPLISELIRDGFIPMVW